VSLLEVPGTQLWYETRGRGPLLVMIPGAFGAGAAFSAVAEPLAAHYTVLTYDRRGFGKSRPTGPQDGAERLETDAADVRCLIEHVGAEPAIVFGASSGGIVALTLLTRHPSVVRILVPFEPPLMRLVPDGAQWIDFFASVYDVYRHSGMEPALALFRERTFAPIDRQVMSHTRARDPRRTKELRANATYWFEHELRQYPAVALDLTALTASVDRIVPAVGRESAGYPCSAATKELGKRLGREVIELPGGHVGFLEQPAVFADTLRHALTGAADVSDTII
jgi:pimeloyl-ACP methyl ester carboxylesterase